MIGWVLGSLIIISTVITLGIFIHVKYKIDDEIIIKVFWSFILFYLVTSIIFGVNIDYKEDNIHYEYRNKTNIYSISDNININGEFVLGIGAIESELYYYVLIGDDKNGYIVDKYEANSIYLIPEENIQPYYTEKYKMSYRLHEKNIMFGGLFKPFKDCEYEEYIREELHLPKNYIKQNYDIDLK